MTIAAAPDSLTGGVTLSPEQLNVVNHRGGHLQVIACAGSGKTESLARRIAALIDEGAPPDSIVAFTFTEKAAAELKHRILGRVGERRGREFLDCLGPLFVGTIHSYCFRLLQTHVPRYGDYDILDDHRHVGLLNREYHRLALKRLTSKPGRAVSDFIDAADIIANELIDASRLQGTDLGEIYAAYRGMLDEYRVLTFGLIVSTAVERLEDPAIAQRVRANLRHLFVDEYQDVNPAQEKLIEQLAKPPVELCVVGDDDQSIYQWRGADVSNFLECTRRYPGASSAVLTTNRRSRPAIVEAANRFAQSIQPRMGKFMEPDRPAAEPQIVAWKAETTTEEAERIAETIEKLHAEGFAYRDMAVLFRSVRTSARPLVEALEKRRIPVNCGGRTGLFQQSEPALFGEIHAWFADAEWKDERYGARRPVDIDAVVAGLERHFNDGRPLDGLKRYLEDWRKDRLSTKRAVTLVGDFYRLLHFLGAHQIDIDTPEGSARFGAFARFSQVLADFEHVTRRGRKTAAREFLGATDRGRTYAQQLARYLLYYAFTAYEGFEGERAADLDAVDVFTVHQAKGLEWPVVFLPALVEGRFPSRRAGQEQQWLLPEAVFPKGTRARYEGSETEERRLFYVAMTRARDCLYLSCFDRLTNRFKPSPFLMEVADGGLRAGELPRPQPSGRVRCDLPPLDVSFSDVAVFDDCGHRYRLANVFGFEQEVAPELGYGKAIHHVLRQVAERARETGRPPAEDEIAALLTAEFYLPLANAPSFERMRRAAERMVRQYLSEYRDDLERLWDIERPFELHLADGTLAGRADVILSQEAGPSAALAIVDYKSSEDPKRDERYHLQLQVYTAAGRGEGLDVQAAYLHELSTGRRIAVDISEGAVASATHRVGASVKAIRAARYAPQPEPEKCRGCDHRRVCRHADAASGEG